MMLAIFPKYKQFTYILLVQVLGLFRQALYARLGCVRFVALEFGVLGKLVSYVHAKPVPESMSKSGAKLDKGQRAFLRLICRRAQRAYPSFLITPGRKGDFNFLVASNGEEPCEATARLDNIYQAYCAAGDGGARERVLESYLSAIGNTVIAMDEPINPARFIVQLRHHALINQAGQKAIHLPFLGDLVAVLMCDGDAALQMVTQANLDTLSLHVDEAFARAIKNAGRLIGEREQGRQPDWPGLAFVRTDSNLQTAEIYQDFMLGSQLPDGAYFVYGPGAYVYAAASDEATMATLITFAQHMIATSDTPISGNLLLRQKANWCLINLVTSHLPA